MRTPILLRTALLTLVIGSALTACSEDEIYDDTALNDKINTLTERVQKLEEQCKQMNTNLNSLQVLVEAAKENDYITSITPVILDKQEIGYTIQFKKNPPITIYHGKNGENGHDGIDGQDGKTPQIGIRKDNDDCYYWTVNDEWLLDNNHQKIKAEGTNGQNGITPQLKIENGFWYVSYDNKKTWNQLHEAINPTPESFFKDVILKDDCVTFILNDTNSTEFNIYLYNDLTLLIGSWERMHYGTEKQTFTFNKDYTYNEYYIDNKTEGTYTYYLSRHMLILHYQSDSSSSVNDDTFTVLEITNDSLTLFSHKYNDILKLTRVK